ncbi:hypothetical protein KC726_05620 [Candidatus Woesebacteria bacterium]|nr:hypothetical protein [Candidatus Woesebacteria bacterium]
MSKYVPDVNSRRWVIISETRNDRPDDQEEKEYYCGLCPFCAGNEYLSPNELFRIGQGEADQPGWEVRVVPNKYPITDFHEVIVHAPQEGKDLHELPKEHVVKVFSTFRQRFNAHKDNGHVMIFSNRGEHAGASIKHPHSQLVVIPTQINLDTLKREPLTNVIEENNFFNIYCPEFSQWPYEVWIAPKEQSEGLFGDLDDEHLIDLVDLYITIMRRLESIYREKARTGGEFSYNFYIHPKKDWYLRIIPRMVYRAGFELGTGLSVNVTDPIDAARELKSREEKIAQLQSTLKKLQEKS